LLRTRAHSDYAVWSDYIDIAHHRLVFGQRWYTRKHTGREGPMFFLSASPSMVFWCQLLSRHSFSVPHRGTFLSVSHWDVCARVYKDVRTHVPTVTHFCKSPLIHVHAIFDEDVFNSWRPTVTKSYQYHLPHWAAHICTSHSRTVTSVPHPSHGFASHDWGAFVSVPANAVDAGLPWNTFHARFVPVTWW
jgi:hypothetical protein